MSRVREYHPPRMQARGLVARAVLGLRAHGVALLALFAVAFAPFVTCALRGEVPFFLDTADHWFPFRLHAHRAWTDGEFAHWCRHAFCGFPFLAQAEAALCYPPHWVLDLFHPAKTLLFQIVGHRFVLAALMYAALRARGLSRTASTLGGALLVGGGLTMNCFTQIAVLRTLAWLPLLLLGATRLAQRRGLEGVLWTALATSLSIVAGYPPFLERAAVVLPFLYLADPAWPRCAADWLDRGARFLLAAAGAALGALMAAAQFGPTMLLTHVSQRGLGLDPALLDAMRTEPLDALMIAAPRVAAQAGIARQGFAYVGVLALALAAFAVARRRPGAAALALAAGAALVASMGRAVPGVGDLLASLPIVGSMRNPGQYLVGWALVLPALAALGLDAWRERRPSTREAVAVIGGTALLLVVAVLVPEPLGDRASIVRAAIGAAGLVAAGAALLVPERVAPLVLVAAAVGDAASFLFQYPTKPGRTRSVASLLEPEEPFATVARRHRAMARESTPRAITSEAVFNWENHGWAAGVDDVRGLVSLVPMWALDMNRIVAEGAPFPREPLRDPLYAYGPVRALDSPRVDLLALRYAIGFPRQPGPEWSTIGPGLWEREAVPEARLVERGRRPATSGRPDAVDPRTGPVIAEVDLPIAAPDAGSVSVVSVRTNEVVMEVDAARAATLLWSQTWFPGWTVAAGGGEPVAPESVLGHMAIPVEAGRSRLVWTFETFGWRGACRGSLAGCSAFVLLAALAWYRARRAARAA